MTSLAFTGSTNDGKWFYDADTASGVWRQSTSIGARLRNYQPNSSPAAAGDANTFFKGLFYAAVVLDEDVTGRWQAADGSFPDVEAYLLARYGAI
jgi:hypothetical protein